MGISPQGRCVSPEKCQGSPAGYGFLVFMPLPSSTSPRAKTERTLPCPGGRAAGVSKPPGPQENWCSLPLL